MREMSACSPNSRRIELDVAGSESAPTFFSARIKIGRIDMPHDDEKLPSADELLLAVSALARHLQSAGIEFLPRADDDHLAPLVSGFPSEDRPQAEATQGKAEEPKSPTGQTPAAKPKPMPQRLPTGDRYSLPVLSADQRTDRLAELQTAVSTCSRCVHLASSRNNTVFGEGSPSARVAFFGEGPGADEDRTGRPFVGRAGQLLTKMIEACTFSREDVYILNTVKCRPPGNRNPEPAELSNCREYFERQLEIIQPEYIVCLGAVSAQALLQTTESVGRLRGRWHPYFASKVLVTYHPAYLLRNPAAKKAAWDDLKMMLSDMGIQV